ncbi:predicted protein [Histoplasma capsulatum var. duboisii H88]|uniref:Predicted protein n=1 Tax=Ajellomyces capsulatus (strain H88) TaxID=544711 RepID=F0UJM5_AJEC8|nr:predicted protein [Histoplasma capsulatum var. duboisii H88]
MQSVPPSAGAACLVYWTPKSRDGCEMAVVAFLTTGNTQNGEYRSFEAPGWIHVDLHSFCHQLAPVVLPPSPKLSPYPPSVEMSSKSSSVVSCGHVQTDVVAFPPKKGISLNSPHSEGINHQEECPQRIPDGNNQPGSTPPTQRQPSDWDTKDPQTK